MRIRDALESDAEALATATDRPRGVVTNMIHDRSVRVAVEEDCGRASEEGVDDGEEVGGESGDGEEVGGESGDGEEVGGESGDSERSTIAGFVAFDVRGETVHVTDFDGDEETVGRLFEEPRRFARREGMSVEAVVPNDERTETVLETAGFEPAGPGPRFEGRQTTRYVIESAELGR